MTTSMREALEAAKSWIERWTSHVGNCRGGNECTCGRTAILAECAAVLSSPADAGGWRDDIENAPRCVEHEERGIYKSDDGSLFYFKPTHWRPSTPHTDKND